MSGVLKNGGRKMLAGQHKNDIKKDVRGKWNKLAATLCYN